MEWTEVKAKPKKKKAPKDESEFAPTFGGKGAKGKLIAGPIKQGQMQKTTGYEDYGDEGYD